jgi:hypothetical protein
MFTCVTDASSTPLSPMLSTQSVDIHVDNVRNPAALGEKTTPGPFEKGARRHVLHTPRIADYTS